MSYQFSIRPDSKSGGPKKVISSTAVHTSLTATATFSFNTTVSSLELLCIPFEWQNLWDIKHNTTNPALLHVFHTSRNQETAWKVISRSSYKIIAEVLVNSIGLNFRRISNVSRAPYK